MAKLHPRRARRWQIVKDNTLQTFLAKAPNERRRTSGTVRSD